ncbi:MAG: molybdenum ABC transporter ATP-binding protein [Pseudomonadota bacterium]
MLASLHIALSVSSIAQRRHDFRVDVQEHILADGVTALFGPSGAGKTTLLRCIAGLKHADGKLVFREQCWQDSDQRLFMPPHQRGIGFVFQHPQLFEHLSVSKNLRFNQQLPDNAVEALVSDFALSDLLDAKPASLSGGEQQRVAIARTLISAPQLLLLDEPLSAVDAAHRRTLLRHLRDHLRAHCIPALYVTHDLAESARIADHMLQMTIGRIRGAGPINEVLTDLAQPFCRTADSVSVIDAPILHFDAQTRLCHVEIDGCGIAMPSQMPPASSEQRLLIGARDISLSKQHDLDSSIVNALDITVTDILKSQDLPFVVLQLQAGSHRMVCHVTCQSFQQMGLTIGDRLTAHVKAVALQK